MSKKGKVRRKNPLGLWLGGALIIFGLLAVISGVTSLLDNKQRLIAPKGVITVEVVDTPEARRTGLSNRETLAGDRGMLFVFDNESQENCIWMKDMRFALDIVWLDSNKTVIHRELNATPESYPDQSFCPDKPAKYVLEINSGRADELGIVEDESLRF